MSRHKGVVTDTADGTSKLYVTLDDGKVSLVDLRKQGARFVPNKQKRSKTWTQPYPYLLEDRFLWRLFIHWLWRLFHLRSRPPLTQFIFLAAHIAADFWVKHSRLEQFQFSLKNLISYLQSLFWTAGSRSQIRFLLFLPFSRFSTCIRFHKVVFSACDV